MVDMNTTKHVVMFPTKIAAASGSPHQWDITISANTDNGTLCTLGNYVSFENFTAGAAPQAFAAKVLEKSPNGNWWIQVTNAAGAIVLYNSPVSPYGEKMLQKEECFYNGKDEGPVRGYALIDTDVYELSENAFNGIPVEGKALSYASGKYVVAS